jgi:threonyl-tRNA synthetase
LSEQIGIVKDGQIFDLHTATEQNLSGEPVFFDNSSESLEIIRHSTAHLMAQAIKSLYSNAKFFVGPIVDQGFYYDFKVDEAISEDDLKIIEKKMKELAKKTGKIEKYSVSKEEALKKYENDELKTAVLSRIPDDEVSFYTQGDFEDLCRGPHLPKTKLLNNFKLTKLAGAYLGGDEKNEMLTRIYGIAFSDKEALKTYITQQEEAKKRDHRKIGTDLALFKFYEEIGGGLAVWLPNGARLRGKLESVLYRAHRRRQYEPLRGPEMLKSDLWRVSGHIQNYGENMYFTNIDDHEYGIKPMNCVGHIKAYEADVRSYRDFPLRYFEFGTVHRHEQSGALHGLLRVREFTQDDAHIFCTEDQIQSEIVNIMAFVESLMSKLDFNYKIFVSTKPEKAIGSDAFWDKATESIKNALDTEKLSYEIDEGGGAFYGPKIDIKVLDAIGREWQCGTIQVDLNLPERFELEYVTQNNEKARPVMLHRAILGSFERFIAIMTEHFAGEYPFWLAPEQVIVIPISDSHLAYAKEIKSLLSMNDIDASVNSKSESLNKRIRMSEMQKVPMIVVIGDKEVEDRTIALRDRRKREQSTHSLSDFLTITKELNEVNI